MKSFTRTAAALCVLGTLSACGHPQAYRATAPDTTSHCVDAPQALNARPLNYLAEKEKAPNRRVEFAAVASCLLVEGTALPVALYQLDALPGKSEIDIRLQLSEGGTFAASVDVLDARFQPLKHHGFTDFVRRSDEYSLSVFVDRSLDPAPAYLLLRPDAHQVGRDDRTVTGQTTALQGPGAAAMYFGREVMRSRPLLAAGQLQVVPYPARRAGFDDAQR